MSIPDFIIKCQTVAEKGIIDRPRLVHAAIATLDGSEMLDHSLYSLEQILMDAGLAIVERQYLPLESGIPIPDLDHREIVPGGVEGLGTRMRLRDMNIGQSVHVDYKRDAPDFKSWQTLMKQARNSITRAENATGFGYALRVTGDTSFRVWRTS